MKKLLLFLIMILIISCKSPKLIELGSNSCCKSILQYLSFSDDEVIAFIKENRKLIILESTIGGLDSDEIETYFRVPSTQQCYEYNEKIIEIDCEGLTYENFVINLWESGKIQVIDSLATSYRYSGVQHTSRIIDFNEQEMTCKCFKNFESIEFEKDYLLIPKKD